VYDVGVHRTIFLVGPTAVGKTAVAHELARLTGRHIVSADSMQVYRGMDIGTAKDKCARLVDVCEITEHFDVKRYVELATPLLPNAIVVGGTGMYVRALRQGLFEGPGRNEELRARLEAMPATRLFDELRQLDPKAAADIDRHNKRRLVRALEVFHATGKSIRDFQTQTSATGTVIGLNRDREDLRDRIERRVDEQMAAGWLDEVRALLERGLAGNPTAMQAAGYRELADHLAGRLTLPDAVALIKARTRQLAKRQLTWFRREPNLVWLEMSPDELPAATARRVGSSIGKGTGENA
jgi:tRNA dimethylallyltransferase